ncbi:MAG: DUF6370 family protein [Bacteroidota bacterium]
MKMLRLIFISILVTGLFACTGNQEKEAATEEASGEITTVDEIEETNAEEQLAQVGCAKCQLGLECEDCQLAVKIGEKAYFVEGVDMDAFAEDGLCSMVKNAKVVGKKADNKFKATKIELIAEVDHSKSNN